MQARKLGAIGEVSTAAAGRPQRLASVAARSLRQRGAVDRPAVRSEHVRCWLEASSSPSRSFYSSRSDQAAAMRARCGPVALQLGGRVSTLSRSRLVRAISKLNKYAVMQ
jgi:hypothetical protein